MTEIFNLNDPDLRSSLPADYTPLLAYRGSIAHGMYIPNSDPASIDDVDLMGVVIGPAPSYFGLQEWGSRGTKEIKQGQYDVVFYEIRKMFSLLLQGNPNVLSLLWLRPGDYPILTDVGRRIVEARQLFVGKHVYNAFAGYAHAQLEKMETREPAELREYMAVTAELKARGAHPNQECADESNEEIERPRDTAEGIARDVSFWATDKLVAKLRHYQRKGENLGYLGEKRKGLILQHGYDSKNAAHLVRLLRMCVEFLRTGELTVYRPDAAELLDIKRGRWPLDRVKAHAADLFMEAKEAKEVSSLPSEPRREEAERLLIAITREHHAAN